MTDTALSADITVVDLYEPAAELRCDLRNAVSHANFVEREAVQWATAVATAWLAVAAIQLRSVLPDAARLHVDTEAWSEDRGENRPTVLRVLGPAGGVLYEIEGDVHGSRPKGIDDEDIDDLVLEVCTSLDHALYYLPPWRLQAWSRLGRATSMRYEVQLPDTPRLDVESSASTGHYVETGRYLRVGDTLEA